MTKDRDVSAHLVDRIMTGCAALLMVLLAWLSDRTLTKLDTVSDQVQVMAVSVQQLQPLAATVREHERRLTVVEIESRAARKP